MTMPTDIEIVDLGIGFPYTSVEQKMGAYDFFRANLKDAQSVREMEFPVQYMFKGVPDIVPEDTDLVDWVVQHMDAFNIRIARVGLSPNGIEAQRRHPDRFVIGMSVDPNDVMGAVRRIEAAKLEHDVVSAMVFPSGCVPQVAIDDPKMYPLYGSAWSSTSRCASTAASSARGCRVGRSRSSASTRSVTTSRTSRS